MVDNKKRLFELMDKLNPNINEIIQPTQTNQSVPADVAKMQQATQKSSTVQFANSRIDTPQEFEDGFKAWFATTGFNPQKKSLSISQAQTLVKNAMISLGYK
jgi:hypothetical protein